MKLRVVLVLFAILLSLVLVPSALMAQGTDLGTIRGTVTDSTGAVVSGARIEIMDLKTNALRNTVTNAAGVYEMFGLSTGEYKVTATAGGFKVKEVKGVHVSSSTTAGVDLVLTVATTTQTVDVSSQAEAINTEDQTISQTISSESVLELPRDSRDVYQFAYLNPNITQGGADGSFKFIGSQSYGASFTVDGQRSNGGIFGDHTASQPTLDAVGDINVLSNNFSAEYGGIANIRVTTKRGGADFHGSIYYENSNSALAAWTVQDKIGKAGFAPSSFQSKYPNPYFNNNVAGGSIGGPLKGIKNTWFFASYEKNYRAQPVFVQSETLPHPTLLAGDFSLVQDSAKPIIPADILSQMTATEIANNTVGGLGQRFITIPSRFINADVQLLFKKYFPQIGASAPINATNGRVPGYRNILSGLHDQDTGTVRVDHDFGSNDHLFAVYNTGALTDDTGQLVQTPYTGLGLTHTVRRDHTLSLSYTKLINAQTINEVRGGFNYEQFHRQSNNTLDGFLSNIGFTSDQVKSYGSVVGPAELDTHGHMAISFSGAFATFNNGGRNTDRPMDQNLITFGDTLTRVVGNHNLRVGADGVRNQGKDGFAVNRGNVRGLLTYTGSKTTPLADLILGEAPTSVGFVMQPRGPMDVHNWEQGYFVQDDWKIRHNLTLNLGFRYEISTPFIDKGAGLVNFDPNYVDPTTGRKGRFVVPSQSTLQYLQPAIINYGVVTASASKLGIGPGLIRQSWDKYAPRVGAAWSIDKKTVVRGGWGLYYPTSAAQGIRDPLATNTFNQGVTNRSQPGNPLNPWPSATSNTVPITGGGHSGFGNQPTASYVDINIKDPRVHQYNVSVERELGWESSVRFSYLASLMHRLIARGELEAFAPSDNPVATTNGDGVTICDPYNNGDCNYSPAELAKMAFPEIPDGIPVWNNSGHGRSDAFQMEFNRRPKHGLMFSASYTYLNQKSVPADSGESSLGSVTYNPFDPNTDYGTDSYVSHHRFVAYGSYALPFGSGRQYASSMPKWLNLIAGGWDTSFSMFAKSGTYFTPYWLCDNCDPVQPGNIATSDIDAVGDYQNSSYRPTIISNDYSKKNGGAIWNINAFGPPPVGGDLFTAKNVAGRNLLQGPGAWGLNLGVHKSFKLAERISMMFSVDVANLLNHPLFMPTQDYAGGGGDFAKIGDFNIGVDQVTGKLLPITNAAPNGGVYTDYTLNDNFGKLNQVFRQEGVDGRRTIRFKGRITF